MTEMDCRTAESMVTRFIDHSLSMNELEGFLDHIEHCPSCYDELETYFIVHEAMQQLDEDKDGKVLDFKKTQGGSLPSLHSIFCSRHRRKLK